MISFTCPKCAQLFSVKDEYGGKRAKCPCGVIMIVPSVVVAVVSPSTARVKVDAEPYMREADPMAEVRFYCEQCRQVYEGFEGCRCGKKHFDAQGFCLFCHTHFSGNRKWCPVCNVDQNIDNTNLLDNANSKELNKGLACWQAGYEEARAKAYCFSMENHLTYARLLVHAGYGDEAWGLLNNLVICCGSSISSRSRLHNAMAHHLEVEAQRADKDSLRAASLFHSLVGYLLCRIQLYENRQNVSGVYGSIREDDQKQEKYYTNRMKGVLRGIGRNKKGKGEQLYAVLRKHYQTLPAIDEQVLQQDVAVIVQTEPPKSKNPKR